MGAPLMIDAFGASSADRRRAFLEALACVVARQVSRDAQKCDGPGEAGPIAGETTDVREYESTA